MCGGEDEASSSPARAYTPARRLPAQQGGATAPDNPNFTFS